MGPTDLGRFSDTLPHVKHTEMRMVSAESRTGRGEPDIATRRTRIKYAAVHGCDLPAADWESARTSRGMRATINTAEQAADSGKAYHTP